MKVKYRIILYKGEYRVQAYLPLIDFNFSQWETIGAPSIYKEPLIKYIEEMSNCKDYLSEEVVYES